MRAGADRRQAPKPMNSGPALTSRASRLKEESMGRYVRDEGAWPASPTTACHVFVTNNSQFLWITLWVTVRRCRECGAIAWWRLDCTKFHHHRFRMRNRL